MRIESVFYYKSVYFEVKRSHIQNVRVMIFKFCASEPPRDKKNSLKAQLDMRAE
jgi:hypothetical protein